MTETRKVSTLMLEIIRKVLPDSPLVVRWVRESGRTGDRLPPDLLAGPMPKVASEARALVGLNPKYMTSLGKFKRMFYDIPRGRAD